MHGKCWYLLVSFHVLCWARLRSNCNRPSRLSTRFTVIHTQRTQICGMLHYIVSFSFHLHEADRPFKLTHTHTYRTLLLAFAFVCKSERESNQLKERMIACGISLLVAFVCWFSGSANKVIIYVCTWSECISFIKPIQTTNIAILNATLAAHITKR